MASVIEGRKLPRFIRQETELAIFTFEFTDQIPPNVGSRTEQKHAAISAGFFVLNPAAAKQINLPVGLFIGILSTGQLTCKFIGIAAEEREMTHRTLASELSQKL